MSAGAVTAGSRLFSVESGDSVVDAVSSMGVTARVDAHVGELEMPLQLNRGGSTVELTVGVVVLIAELVVLSTSS